MALSNDFMQGFNYLPSYQVSGIPFLKTVSVSSGATVQISFPFITSFLHFNTDSSSVNRRLRIGFSANSIANGKYLETSRLIRNDSGIVDPVFMYRCKEIFVKNPGSGTIRLSVMAGLTTIPASEFPSDYESAVYGL